MTKASTDRVEMPRIAPEAYRPLGRKGGRVSPVGFGCYRVDDRVPAHREALREALRAGVNLIDTSTNYGDGHSEILVGQVLGELEASTLFAREEVVVVTKAGYVQGANLREATKRAKEGRPWPEVVEVGRDIWHCISPDFLRDQLGGSLKRLARPRVDVFLLHNPEYFLSDAARRGVPLEEARRVFYDRIRRAFLALEEEAASGRIGAYGISSNTFVVPHDRPDAVDLTRVLALAGPGFDVVQLPMNPLELGAREPIHTAGRSVLDAAREAGLGVLVNRPLNAFAGGASGLVRFATPRLPFEAPAGTGDPFAELAKLESEFSRAFARKIRMGPGMPTITELLALAELLREVKEGVSDLATFTELWEEHVAPRLGQLLPQLEEVFAKDRSFPAFARSYRRAALRAGAAAAEPARANEARRAEDLTQTLREAFGGEDVEGESLPQRTLRAIAGTPGVGSVLVGMRRPEYVRDVVAGFSSVREARSPR